jgi:hypothetical protein
MYYMGIISISFVEYVHVVDVQALLVMDQKPGKWYDSHGNNQQRKGIQNQRLHTKITRIDIAAKTKKS